MTFTRILISLKAGCREAHPDPVGLTGGPKTVMEARIAFHQQEIKLLKQLALEAA